MREIQSTAVVVEEQIGSLVMVVRLKLQNEFQPPQKSDQGETRRTDHKFLEKGFTLSFWSFALLQSIIHLGLFRIVVLFGRLHFKIHMEKVYGCSLLPYTLKSDFMPFAATISILASTRQRKEGTTSERRKKREIFEYL